MLIVGIADVTRRYAATTARVKEAAAEIRAGTLVQNLLADLERADPTSIRLSADSLSATVGMETIDARLVSKGTSKVVEWSSPRVSRSVRLPMNARFERTASGAIVVRTQPGAPPLAIVLPRRSVPFDCKFDTVARACQ
jgi:hypothetical protein